MYLIRVAKSFQASQWSCMPCELSCLAMPVHVGWRCSAAKFAVLLRFKMRRGLSYLRFSATPRAFLPVGWVAVHPQTICVRFDLLWGFQQLIPCLTPFFMQKPHAPEIELLTHIGLISSPGLRLSAKLKSMTGFWLGTFRLRRAFIWQ